MDIVLSKSELFVGAASPFAGRATGELPGDQVKRLGAMRSLLIDLKCVRTGGTVGRQRALLLGDLVTTHFLVAY
jgi:hypothetical protein